MCAETSCPESAMQLNTAFFPYLILCYSFSISLSLMKEHAQAVSEKSRWIRKKDGRYEYSMSSEIQLCCSTKSTTNSIRQQWTRWTFGMFTCKGDLLILKSYNVMMMCWRCLMIPQFGPWNAATKKWIVICEMPLMLWSLGTHNAIFLVP